MAMKPAQVDSQFWRDKKVFLTGHTGFKGSWLSLWLTSMGAKVTGYALAPNTTPNLFDILAIDSLIEKSHIADIRDLSSLQKVMSSANPDVVIHMAAQPLVRYSYVNPVETYATNVMGTVHVLESMRNIDSIRATVVVTTDKCYENKEWVWGYREGEPMGGCDPYSNSKGCAELVTSAYRQSYFSKSDSINNIASARAGNVIGGGDWSEDRLIPDAIKAFEANKSLMIRNPFATRPWQHVLEPLSGYLILAQALYERGSDFASSWNFGPRDEDNRSVRDVIDLLIAGWGGFARWEKEDAGQVHEAGLLKLDCSKAHMQLGWRPKWDLETAIQKIIHWKTAYKEKRDMREFTLAQIYIYLNS
ncbi:CDP-glucose 4,6-dehydratase [Polynucleobacter sp. TSB-Sco08W16]|uniref:CDP-glucose 4,6-dehydratase n=1 Tax=Polynucleobacter sp. TSB-Sco08W16 TaxID=1758374 RepID=UPI00203CDCFA|nr:CDP-glucose 4,6-dehydratase [Polynucleobacter sp. TSB-Sco08W16]